MSKRKVKTTYARNAYAENETMRLLEVQDYGEIYSSEVLDMIKDISTARQERIDIVLALDIFMAGYTYGKNNKKKGPVHTQM